MKEFFGHALFSYGRYVQEIGALFGLQKPSVRLTDDKCQQLAALLKKVDKGVEYLTLPASKRACEELMSNFGDKRFAALRGHSTTAIG